MQANNILKMKTSHLKKKKVIEFFLGGRKENHSDFHWPEAKHDLIVPKMSVVINREDGLGFHDIPGKKAVVEAVFFCADNLQAWVW